MDGEGPASAALELSGGDVLGQRMRIASELQAKGAHLGWADGTARPRSLDRARSWCLSKWGCWGRPWYTPCLGCPSTNRYIHGLLP